MWDNKQFIDGKIAKVLHTGGISHTYEEEFAAKQSVKINTTPYGEHFQSEPDEYVCY